MPEQIHYELPLNERIRTFLKLEDLFVQMMHYSQFDDEWLNRAEIGCLLDIFSICSRSDLKTEISKEIDRLINQLVVFAQNPNVDRAKLENSIEQLQQLLHVFNTSTGRLDQPLHDVELLKALSKRNSVPGGTCEFDIPAYHFWLNQPIEARRTQINSWYQHLAALHQSIQLLLQFIRSSAQPSLKIAEEGFYQQALDGNLPTQLIRVSFDRQAPYCAEFSGGKHRFTVRFMIPSDNEKPVQVVQDIPFTLSICQL